VATTKPISNRRLLRRAEKFMNYYRPDIVILKEVGSAKNSGRTDRLIEAITTLSSEMGIRIYRYTRQQVKDVFEVFGADSKYKMAESIVKMLPDLAARVPKEKKWYEKEDYNMVLFDAVSLAVTHRYLTE
jgi:Holliday junction resolvasome RuvABC endonuclease subunit